VGTVPRTATKKRSTFNDFWALLIESLDFIEALRHGAPSIDIKITSPQLCSS